MDDFTEKYVQRRTLQPHKAYTSKIEAINIIDNGDSASVQLYIRAGGQLFSGSLLISESIHVNHSDLEFLSNIDLEDQVFTPKKDIIPQLNNSYINLCFSEEYEKCYPAGCDESTGEVFIQNIDEDQIPSDPNIELPDRYEKFLEKSIICRNRYLEVTSGENKDRFWKLTIDDVYVSDEKREEFTVVATESVIEPELEWNFSLPETISSTTSSTVDMQKTSPSTQLIEYVGGGLPNQLKGEDIYVTVPTQNLQTVKSDKTGLWKMVLPQEVQRWRKEHNTSKNEESSFLSKIQSLF